MSSFDDPRAVKSSASYAASVDAFLEASRRNPARAAPPSSPGRLIFALDATMSRQPTWDMAITLQGRMFETTAALGGLEVQLVYFRGLSECRASPFVSGGAGLSRYMSKISVEGGNTQIGRVLSHGRDEAMRAPVGALVYVGDSMEERIDGLCAKAGELALLGVKAFMFHEGKDPLAARAFKEIARLTGGAYAAFDATSPGKLGELLSAAAAYAAGGTQALTALTRKGDGSAKNLLLQMR